MALFKSKTFEVLLPTLDEIDVGIAYFDSNLKLKAWNRAFNRLAFTDGELSEGLCHRDVFAGNLAILDRPSAPSLPSVFSDQQNQTENDSADVIEYQTAVGTWVRLKRTPAPDGGLVCICTDISEINQKAREAQEIRAFMSTLIDFMPAQVSVKDAQGRYVLVNRTVGRITGNDPEKMIGRTPRDISGVAAGDKLLERDAQALARPGEIIDETDILDLPRWGLRHVRSLKIAPPLINGERYVVSLTEDVSERVAADERLKQLVQQLRQHEQDLTLRSLAMDATARAIAVCTLDGDSPKVICSNRPLAALLGDAKDSGSAFLDLFTAGRRLEIVEVLKAALTQGRTHTSEEPISPPGGGEMFARIMIEPVSTELVGSPMVLISIADRTEEQAREEEMAQGQRLRAIGQVTGGVAHDFNNLLTIVTACSDILLTQKGLDDDSLSLIQTIADTVDRAASLTAQLLSFGRRRPLETRHIDLRPYLERIQSVLQRVVPSSINVQLCMERGLADLKADPAQLETALLNLAINARDAIQMHGSLHGVIRLVAANKTIQAEKSSSAALPPGDYVSLSVIDDGPGMSEDVLQQAFEPFFTTKDVGQGSGLGLSMVYGFARQSGGRVRIESSPGSGAKVELLLPRSNSGPATVPDPANPDAVADFGSVGVLVVEDTPEVLEHAVRLIRALGFRTYSASSAAEALSVLRQHRDVDLLFTDVVMAGGVNGVALAKAARTERPDLKVLFTSGYSEEDPEAMRVLSDGAPLLKKPYRSADLARTLKQAVSGRSV
jgi:PAS domain S-box-containing protein